MEKYIAYGIFEVDTNQLLKVGRYPTLYPRSLDRLNKSLTSDKRLELLGTFDTNKECINFLNKLKNPKKSPIVHTKEVVIPSKVRRHRAVFTDEHKPTDINGYLLYIQTYDGYTLVKI
jgi:hypothetical protein